QRPPAARRRPARLPAPGRRRARAGPPRGRPAALLECLERAQPPAVPLAAAPGDQVQAVGETAGIMRRRPHATTVARFIAQLPRDVACASPIYDEHAYV